MRFLSKIYRDCGRQQNIESAIHWMEMAAEVGEPESMCDVGILYESLGDAESMKKAIMWLEKASAEGYPDATYELSLMYKDGKGVKKDMHKSQELLILKEDQEKKELANGKWVRKMM